MVAQRLAKLAAAATHQLPVIGGTVNPRGVRRGHDHVRAREAA